MTIKMLYSCLGIMLLCAGVSMAQAGQVSVAVASNFLSTLRDLAPLFEEKTGHQLKVSFGSTGRLYSQIENGAPFEVFMAADEQRPARAEAQGLAVTGSRFTYGLGQLVLWSPKENLFNSESETKAYLQAGDFSRLAVANPKTAPYGVAAQQVLESMGLWSRYSRMLVRGDSIAQAFQFTATANANLGFVSFSQLKSWQAEPGSLWFIPQTYYQPIRQQVVLLKKGKDNAAALAFMVFLQSPAARALIADYGYGRVPLAPDVRK
ncbi:MAG: molybdate ABC transporter substrate-binding protein [Pontibacterium sp.]